MTEAQGCTAIGILFLICAAQYKEILATYLIYTACGIGWILLGLVRTIKGC